MRTIYKIEDYSTELMKNKLKREPNFVKTKEFAKWRDKNISNISLVLELLSALPRDMEIDISWLIKDDTTEIKEDCITHIQRKRKVGYLEAKRIFEEMKSNLH